MHEDNNTNRWMEVAKWAGESESAIKGLDKELKGVRKAIVSLDDKLIKLNEKLDSKDTKINNRLTNIQIKYAGLSATVALLVTIATVMLSNMLGG